ncbi:MAG: hypothetical protein KR126chlam1_00986 [Chlamydiae bacterium]|nr:hypothetical protein [Chlamydiota bacterium]
MDQIVATAHRDELPRLLEWVRQKIGETLLEKGEKMRLELALEEAIVNVIEHGASDGSHELILTCRYVPDRHIQFELFDDGPAFNPLANIKKIDREAPLEERELGGLGIPLMQECADVLLYRREGDQNVLTLVKNLTNSKE